MDNDTLTTKARIKEREKHLDTIRGSIFSGAVGDAGDYSVEFMSCSDIQRVYGNAGICSYNYDYLFPGKVQVALYDDRLEVTSPGMLDTELTIEQMKTGLSRIRNRGIAEVFAYMHMVFGLICIEGL